MASSTPGKSIAEFLHELLGVLKSYIRGQVLIAFWMVILYSAAFAMLGVPLWPLLGLVCGFLHLVPMLGAVLGLLIPVTAVLVAGGGTYKILGVVGVFVVAQALEGFYLSPRILGTQLRLRPLFVFLALLIGASLLGFVGAVAAVPALAIAVLAWRIFYRRDRPESGGRAK